MEGLIIFLIIGILSAIFNKDKKKQNPTMPPFDQNQKPKMESPKKLDDFAKEIYKQLSDKTESTFEIEDEKQIESKPIVNNQKEQSVRRQPLRQSIQTEVKTEQLQQRPIDSIQMNNKVEQNKKQPTFGFVSSKKELVKAIIAQEILGPPKAKRR